MPRFDERLKRVELRMFVCLPNLALAQGGCERLRRQSGLDQSFPEKLAVLQPLEGEVSLGIVDCAEARLLPKERVNAQPHGSSRLMRDANVISWTKPRALEKLFAWQFQSLERISMTYPRSSHAPHMRSSPSREPWSGAAIREAAVSGSVAQR